MHHFVRVWISHLMHLRGCLRIEANKINNSFSSIHSPGDFLHLDVSQSKREAACFISFQEELVSYGVLLFLNICI